MNGCGLFFYLFLLPGLSCRFYTIQTQAGQADRLFFFYRYLFLAFYFFYTLNRFVGYVMQSNIGTFHNFTSFFKTISPGVSPFLIISPIIWCPPRLMLNTPNDKYLFHYINVKFSGSMISTFLTFGRRTS